jgi:bifunctional DNase/RNase
MTDTKQPEALRLAEKLPKYFNANLATSRDIDQVVAELRRLHEVNAELLEALKDLIDKVRVESWNEKVYYQAALAISKATGELK